MSIQKLTVAVATNGAGAATVLSPSFTGRLLAIHWVKPAVGGITGAALAITSVLTGEPVLSVAGLSASADYYPRGPTHTIAGVAQLYAAAGLPVTDALAFFQDQLQLAITGGGANANATAIVIFDGQTP